MALEPPLADSTHQRAPDMLESPLCLLSPGGHGKASSSQPMGCSCDVLDGFHYGFGVGSGIPGTYVRKGVPDIA